MRSVRLWRWRPPFARSIVVRAVTIRGFMDLVRLAASRAAEVKTLAGRDITGEDIVRAMREPEFLGFADAVCRSGTPGAPVPGFLGGWLSRRNLERIMRASSECNNWRRFLGCLNLTGKPNRGGSIMEDVQAVCHLFPGLDPIRMMDEWAFEDFLNFCDALNVHETPATIDQDFAVLASMPGFEMVH